MFLSISEIVNFSFFMFCSIFLFQARDLSAHAESKHSKLAETACFPNIEEIKARDAAKGK
jgi:hypothetical protein